MLGCVMLVSQFCCLGYKEDLSNGYGKLGFCELPCFGVWIWSELVAAFAACMSISYTPVENKWKPQNAMPLKKSFCF